MKTQAIFMVRKEGSTVDEARSRGGGGDCNTCVQVKEQIDLRIRDNRKIVTDETGICHGEKQCKNGLRPN
jgi:hypothetical protein